MRNSKTEYSNALLLAGVTFTGLIFSVLRLLVVSANHAMNEDGVTYYIIEDGLPLVFAIIVLLLALLCLPCAYIFSRSSGVVSNRVSPSVAVTCLIFAVLAPVASAAWLIFDNPQTFVLFKVLIPVCAVGTSVRFFFYGKKKLLMKSKGFPYLNLFVVFFYTIRILSDFMVQTASPLDSSGGYHFTSLIAVMLFFMLEGKASAGTVQRFLYTLFGFLALLLIPIYSIPAILLCATAGIGTVGLAVFSAADIAAGAYIALRLRLCCHISRREE